MSVFRARFFSSVFNQSGFEDKALILDLVVGEERDLPGAFVEKFSKVNYALVDDRFPVESQVSRIEGELGAPDLDRMLVFSDRFRSLGTVLSRRYVNAAEIGVGPLKIGGACLSPVHLSLLPDNGKPNRVLFLAPHADEAYLAAVLPHRLAGDKVFLHSFTPMEDMDEVRRGYGLLGLSEDDFNVGSLRVNSLHLEKSKIGETILRLVDEFNPDVVFSVSPDTANFDHIAVSQVVREVVLKQTGIDVIYGHVIQSRNRKPVIYLLLSGSVARRIFRAFGKRGFGEVFTRYLAYLKNEMQTFSEPLIRMIGEGKLQNVYSLPIEAERIENYRIPSFLQM